MVNLIAFLLLCITLTVLHFSGFIGDLIGVNAPGIKPKHEGVLYIACAVNMIVITSAYFLTAYSTISFICSILFSIFFLVYKIKKSHDEIIRYSFPYENQDVLRYVAEHELVHNHNSLFITKKERKEHIKALSLLKDENRNEYGIILRTIGALVSWLLLILFCITICYPDYFLRLVNAIVEASVR